MKLSTNLSKSTKLAFKIFEAKSSPNIGIFCTTEYFQRHLCTPKTQGKKLIVASYISTSVVLLQCSVLGPYLFNIFINDLPLYIRYSEILLYADDLKIFRVVNSLEDSDLLQADIDSVVEWSVLNYMFLNESKCLVGSFSNKSIVPYRYLLHGSRLVYSSLILDLGIYFDPKLSFKQHVLEIASSAARTLGFVIKISSNFQNTDTFKLLYNSLVRSILEYGSPVWNPDVNEYSQVLEKVQKRFLRYMYFRTHGIYPHYKSHPVRSADMRTEFTVQLLESRRHLCDCIFIYKLLNNRTDCPQLLSLLPFRINVKNTRATNLFSVLPLYQTPVSRILSRFNTYCDAVDVFAVSLGHFRSSVLRVIEGS